MEKIKIMNDIILHVRVPAGASKEEVLKALTEEVERNMEFESEDERVRKTLVQLVEDAWAGRETAEVSDEKVYHACLAYLEKQKEWSEGKCLEGVLDYEDLSQLELAIAAYWEKNRHRYFVTCEHQRQVLMKLYALAGYDYNDFNHEWEDEK